jgi:predicted ribosome quality control (RQC) complex YloA/Tae2 family protein
MTLDGLTLHIIVNELKEPVNGCKVDKVHQPQPDTVVLSLRAPGKNPKLLISAGAFNSRLHLTDQKHANPLAPPMFCMFLRKHLTGAKIVNIHQMGLERIVRFSLEAKDELGLPHMLTLIAELMGRVLSWTACAMCPPRRAGSAVCCQASVMKNHRPRSSIHSPFHAQRWLKCW